MGQDITAPKGRAGIVCAHSKGTRAASRWLERARVAARDARKTHNLSTTSGEILLVVVEDAGFSRAPVARNYSAHQLARKLGRARSTVQEALKRMGSIGLATLVQEGNRGRGHAGLWEIALLGPSFSEVVAEGRAKGLAARRRRPAAQNAGNRPLPPPRKKSTSSEATPKGPAKVVVVAVGPEGALEEAAVQAGLGRGGARKAAQALKGTNPEILQVLGKHIRQVLDVLRRQSGTRSAEAVFVARCQLGRGRELAEIALGLERAAKKAEALAPPRFSDLVAAWRTAKTYKTTTALSEAITRCLGHARQDEIREEVQAALPGKDLFDTEVLDALWAARLKACGIQP